MLGHEQDKTQSPFLSGLKLVGNQFFVLLDENKIIQLPNINETNA